MKSTSKMFKALAGVGLLVALAAWVLLPSSVFADVVTYKEGSPDPFLGGTYSGTEDTMIVTNGGGSQDQNFGGRLDFEVGEALDPRGFLRHVLVRFDLSSLAGQFSTINSVTLRLFVNFRDVPASASDTVQAFRLSDANAGWVEGTSVGIVGGDPPDNGESTWNQRVQGSENWAGSAGASTAGTDYTVLLATTAFDSSIGIGAPFDLNVNSSLVQDLIQDWTTGTNAGLFLRTGLEANRRLSFHSSEASDPALRPQLIIDFTSETDKVTDHFKCYKADGDDVDVIVSLDDQFGFEPQVLVGQPKFFCNPVDKNGEGIGDPTAHLTCYKIEGNDEELEVVVANQFGEQTLKVDESKLLCVPSEKVEVFEVGDDEDDDEDDDDDDDDDD